MLTDEEVNILLGLGYTDDEPETAAVIIADVSRGETIMGTPKADDGGDRDTDVVKLKDLPSAKVPRETKKRGKGEKVRQKPGRKPKVNFLQGYIKNKI